MLASIVVPGADDGKKEEEPATTVVAMDEDDSEGEELNIGGTANEPKPKREDKVRGQQSYAVLKKKGESLFFSLPLARSCSVVRGSRQQGQASWQGQGRAQGIHSRGDDAG